LTLLDPIDKNKKKITMSGDDQPVNLEPPTEVSVVEDIYYEDGADDKLPEVKSTPQDEILGDLDEEKDWNPAYEMVGHQKVVIETKEVVGKAVAMMKVHLRNNNGIKQEGAIPEDFINDDKYLLRFLRVTKFDPKRTIWLER